MLKNISVEHKVAKVFEKNLQNSVFWVCLAILMQYSYTYIVTFAAEDICISDTNPNLAFKFTVRPFLEKAMNHYNSAVFDPIKNFIKQKWRRFSAS